jgi:hypothetical protein
MTTTRAITRQIMWQKRREKGFKVATIYLSKATNYLSNNMTTNRNRLDALARVLLREESLNEEQMREATGLPKRPTVESAIAASR